MLARKIWKGAHQLLAKRTREQAAEFAASSAIPLPAFEA